MVSYSLSPKRSRLFLILTLLVILSTACSLGGNTGTGPINQITATPVPGAVIADYGDAPDGDRNMDTGYYAPTGGPFLFTYSSAGVSGNFPTMGDDPIPGAFTVDVDEFWIGPLFGGSEADVPSLENDADDPNDPDGVANLLIQGGGADCDAENGSQNPAGNGCASVPAYSLPMNARLMIMFGYPPLGIWITSVTASEDMGYSGPVYWNLLFDLDQNGSWDGDDEWISQDMVVNLAPGETVTLISPAFRFPTSGTPWGRLNFPYWVRSMVSSESIQDKLGSNDWDGRGTVDGFAVGEVEDYFVEWRPIGQKFPGEDPEEFASCGTSVSDLDLEQIPTSRDPWAQLQIIPGVQVERVEVLATSGPDISGEVINTEILSLNLTGEVPISIGDTEVIFKVEPNLVQIEGSSGSTPAGVVLLPEVMDSFDCTGTAPVLVTPGIFLHYNPITGESVFWEPGVFNMGFLVIYDKAGHEVFVGMPSELLVEILFGSITIKGPHPWVEVSGEFNEETGEFNATGTGTVAGFPNIEVSFNGQLRKDGISGEYSMGVGGGLPQKEPITYAVDGSRVEASETTPVVEADGPVLIDPGVDAAIGSFVEVFNAAFVDGNPDHLYQLLHPGVVELYGEEACLAYLGGIIQTPTTLEYLKADWVGPWIFERDGKAIPVEDAYIVAANFTANQQSVLQNLHLSLRGDDSVRWFTDCGDPLVE